MRKSLLVILLAILAFSCKQKESQKPNVVFIMADDLGYGDVGAFGQKTIPTPHIDQLASEGMKLTRHYAGNTVCAPSRCTLMTGLHNGHARVRGNALVPLKEEDVTVAELFKQAGYKTALIGKWGLGEEGSSGVPTRQGFDYFFGYLNQRHAHNHFPNLLFENETRYTTANDFVAVDSTQELPYGGISKNKEEYGDYLFRDRALKFIAENKDKPFFLYLPLVIPHANNESKHFGESGMEIPDYSAFADKDWPDNQKRQAAMVVAADSIVGAVMAELKKQGLDKNTLVIFTSDNGPHREGGGDPDFFDSNGIYRGIKRDLYDGGIRVPTIARWPGKIEPGTSSELLSGFVDFFETMAELIDLQHENHTDGISFLPTLLGKDQEAHDYLYWEFYEQGGKQGLLMDNWKCIKLMVNVPEEMTVELYDQNTDPGEENNIASEHPDIVEKAVAIMEKEHTLNEDFKFAFEE